MWGAKKKIYRFYIGIDCGVSTGICIWSRESKTILQIDTVTIHRALEAVKCFLLLHPGEVLVRVEDARLRTWIPQGKNLKAELGRREGAGSVKRDAVIWEDFLSDLQVPFEMVAPKDNQTKVSADYFQKLTGYKGLTSKHSRDAGMLVCGF